MTEFLPERHRGRTDADISAVSASCASDSTKAESSAADSSASQSVSESDLSRLASLAALNLPSDRAALARFEAAVQGIIEWTDQIRSARASAVAGASGEGEGEGVGLQLEPLRTVLDCDADSEGLRLRADAVDDGGYSAAVLSNAPHRDRSFFLVPKVVDLEDS